MFPADERDAATDFGRHVEQSDNLRVETSYLPEDRERLEVLEVEIIQ